jgi:hypothetical protein
LSKIFIPVYENTPKKKTYILHFLPKKINGEEVVQLLKILLFARYTEVQMTLNKVLSHLMQQSNNFIPAKTRDILAKS